MYFTAYIFVTIDLCLSLSLKETDFPAHLLFLLLKLQLLFEQSKLLPQRTRITLPALSHFLGLQIILIRAVFLLQAKILLVEKSVELFVFEVSGG